MQGDALAIFLFFAASGMGAVIGAIAAPSGWRANALWAIAASFFLAAYVSATHPVIPAAGTWKVITALSPLVSVLLVVMLQGRSLNSDTRSKPRAVSTSVKEKVSPERGENSPIATLRIEPERPTIPPEQKQDRIFIPASMNFQSLTSPFETLTSVQATRTVSNYIGKWMRVDSHFYDLKISNLDNACHVYLCDIMDNGGYAMYPLGVDFNAEWLPKLEVLSRGLPISVIGKIERIERYSVNLESCELIEPNPTVPSLPMTAPEDESSRPA